MRTVGRQLSKVSQGEELLLALVAGVLSLGFSSALVSQQGKQ